MGGGGAGLRGAYLIYFNMLHFWKNTMLCENGITCSAILTVFRENVDVFSLLVNYMCLQQSMASSAV